MQLLMMCVCVWAGTSRGGWRSNKIVKAPPPPSPSHVTSSSNTRRGGGEYIIGIKKNCTA